MKRKKSLFAGLVALGGLAAVFTTLVRPRLNKWGATEHEAQMHLPGDALADGDSVCITHALDIEADVHQVWPWLVQIGQGRGGFYSYTWLENLVGSAIRNVKEVVPRLQDLQEGDAVSLHPAAPPLTVVDLDEPHNLVLQGGKEHDGQAKTLYDNIVWSFHLRPHGRGSSRLIARVRASWPAELSGKAATVFFMEPAHFVMERKMLLTIKALAERSVGS